MSRPLFRSVLEQRLSATGATSCSRWSCCPAASIGKRSLGTSSAASFTGTIAQVDPPPHASSSILSLPSLPSSPRPLPTLSTIPGARRGPPTSPSPAPGRPKPLSESVRQLLPALKSQPMHYVTVHIHGFPYLVTAGDEVRLPARMPGVVPGDVLRLNRASVLGSRDYTLKGSPFVDERLYTCRATVIGLEAEPMRVEVKKKQRCRRKTTMRNKMRFTVLRISELRIKSLEEIEGEKEVARTAMANGL